MGGKKTNTNLKELLDRNDWNKLYDNINNIECIRISEAIPISATNPLFNYYLGVLNKSNNGQNNYKELRIYSSKSYDANKLLKYVREVIGNYEFYWY